MFKILRHNRGQGITSQYTLTFFLVVAVVASMTVHFKRAVQGRIRDATHYMAQTVSSEYNGTVYGQYEPYYLVLEANRQMDSLQETILEGSFNSATGITTTRPDITTVMETFSNQLRPGLAP